MKREELRPAEKKMAEFSRVSRLRKQIEERRFCLGGLEEERGGGLCEEKGEVGDDYGRSGIGKEPGEGSGKKDSGRGGGEESEEDTREGGQRDDGTGGAMGIRGGGEQGLGAAGGNSVEEGGEGVAACEGEKGEEEGGGSSPRCHRSGGGGEDRCADVAEVWSRNARERARGEEVKAAVMLAHNPRFYFLKGRVGGPPSEILRTMFENYRPKPGNYTRQDKIR